MFFFVNYKYKKINEHPFIKKDAPILNVTDYLIRSVS